jgi:hypothetical protein
VRNASIAKPSETPVCTKRQHTRQARYRLHGRTAIFRGTP